MFGEEADSLGSGVEKEVRDLANEPSLAPSSLRPLAIAFPVAFKALVTAPRTAPIVTPAARTSR